MGNCMSNSRQRVAEDVADDMFKNEHAPERKEAIDATQQRHLLHNKSIQEEPLQVQYMAHTPFFVALSRDDMHAFSMCFRQREFHDAGTSLFETGDEADTFYIVAQGEVKITVIEQDTGESRMLASKGPGDFFGEEAVISDAAAVRSFAATTMGDDVKVLVVSRSQLREFFAQNPSMRDDVLTIMRREYDKVLRNVSFLQNVPEDKLKMLSSALHYVTLEEDCTLFEEGSLGSSLYIVAVGHLNCTAVKDGKSKLLNEFGPGSYFGETALMLSVPRTATLTATKRCLLLELRKQDLRNFLNLVPELNEEFKAVVRERTAQSFRKYQVPFFEAIPDDKYPLLASLCKIEELQPGQKVYEEGDQGESFYMVAHGQLEVTSTSVQQKAPNAADVGGDKGDVRQVLGQLRGGQFFGEVALIQEGQREHTVTALTRCVVLSISKAKFDVFFEEVPEAVADFHVKLDRYNIELRQLIHHALGVEYLTRYLATEYSQENIDFWKACREFQTLFDEVKKEENSEKADVERPKGANDEDEEKQQEPPEGEEDQAKGETAKTAADDSEVNDEVETEEAARRIIKEAGLDYDEIAAKAQWIHDEFISTESMRQVNIKDSERLKIVHKCDNKLLHRDMFSAAAEEILGLIDTDSFRRFKQSQLFQEFLEKTA